MVAGMIAGNDFVLTFIAEHPDPGEDVEGAALLQLTCQALTVGQALLVVGGYIVRGTPKQCRRRATAIRHEKGAFDVVPVPMFSVVARVNLLDAPPDAGATSAASFAMGVGYLAIENTPSFVEALLPRLEQQFEVDNAELPMQERIQLFEPKISARLLQQFEDDVAAAKLESMGVGKQQQQQPQQQKQLDTLQQTIDQDSFSTTKTMKVLLDRTEYLENIISQKHTYNAPSGPDSTKPITITPLHVRIATPTPNSAANNGKVDELQ